MKRLAPCFRSARRALPFAVALLIAACSTQSAEPGADTSDPALQDHSRWCGTSPPSGYCDIDDHR